MLSPGFDRTRTLRGAVSGALAATVWALQQPLDKRAFGSSYDDVELLGRALISADGWYPVGLALHVQSGALFGALYRNLSEESGRSPAVALRAAQLEMIRSGGWRAKPSYWGAYFVVGSQ